MHPAPRAKISRMSELSIPFNPLREELYTPEDLFGEFDPKDASSYARCADITILSYFWKFGMNPTLKSGAATLEALHDNAMSLATRSFTKQHANVIAIMGGHGMKRGETSYRGISHIAHTWVHSYPGGRSANWMMPLLSSRKMLHCQRMQTNSSGKMGRSTWTSRRSCTLGSRPP